MTDLNETIQALREANRKEKMFSGEEACLVLSSECVDALLSAASRADTAERELRETNVRVARMREAIESAEGKFGAYFEYYGVEHESFEDADDDECPEDSTCACPLVVGVNDAFADLRRARECK